MRKRNYLKGFTLIEILVVIAISAIIAVTSVVGFQALYQSSTLRAGSVEVFGALTSARTNTLASQGGTVFGVHISSTTVTRFEGSTFVLGNATNKVYEFEGGVTATGTLVTSGASIIFTRLTGETSPGGTLYIHDSEGTSTTTIAVHPSGLVEYQ